MKKSIKKQMLPLNLQLFADDPEVEDKVDNPKPDGTTSDDAGEDTVEPEAKYTDDDVNKLINKKFAEWKVKHDEEIKEAEKLAKMNADDKEKYRVEKLEKEIEEYKRKEAFDGLAKEATKMLQEHEINAGDDLINILVRDDAEATQTVVNEFATLINDLVEAGVTKALEGEAPKRFKNEINTSLGGLTLNKHRIVQ